MGVVWQIGRVVTATCVWAVVRMPPLLHVYQYLWPGSRLARRQCVACCAHSQWLRLYRFPCLCWS